MTERVHGILIESHKNKHHEMEAMRRMVEALTPEMRQLIVAIRCSESCYGVVATSESREAVRRAIVLSDEIMHRLGGAVSEHNGIDFSFDGPVLSAGPAEQEGEEVYH